MRNLNALLVTPSELSTIAELALNEAKRIHELFGERLPEFPVMQERILELGALSLRANAALNAKGAPLP